jgi:hypothetical protein
MAQRLKAYLEGGRDAYLDHPDSHEELEAAIRNGVEWLPAADGRRMVRVSAIVMTEISGSDEELKSPLLVEAEEAFRHFREAIERREKAEHTRED